MQKNILIFSDGTGQAGGLTPDERISNIYKLYRATRVGPESSTDPAEQLAYYDAGLGSRPPSGGSFETLFRIAHNFLSQATGFGLTTIPALLQGSPQIACRVNASRCVCHKASNCDCREPCKSRILAGVEKRVTVPIEALCCAKAGPGIKLRATTPESPLPALLRNLLRFISDELCLRKIERESGH